MKAVRIFLIDNRHLISHYRNMNRIEIEKQFEKFVVLGLGYWGKGDTIKEAKKNCIREGCKSKDKMIAFVGDMSIGVTSGGCVQADKILISLGEI